MFTHKRRLISHTVLAAVALLYADSRNWLGDAGPEWAEFSTPIGGLKHVVLQDGSHVDLNTGSGLRARFTSGRREIVMIRGEAVFHVEHNERWPFTVSAANTTVNAVGTTFSIRIRNQAAADLRVSQGHVAVGSEEAGPGDLFSLKSGSVQARSRLSPATLERDLAWTGGWIWFSKEPLTEALAEFNRYHRERLVLADPRLASLEIGGRFRASDLDSFIATLEHSFNVRKTASAVRQANAAIIYLDARCDRAQQQCNWPLVQ